MNRLFLSMTLPCGCVLENTYVDRDPLTTPEQRSAFLHAGGKVLQHWSANRAVRHTCAAAAESVDALPKV